MGGSGVGGKAVRRKGGLEGERLEVRLKMGGGGGAGLKGRL